MKKQDGIYHNHMSLCWNEMFPISDTTPAISAPLKQKASLIGRIGLSMLSCGTGAYRVRQSMNLSAETLFVKCNADIGLLSINYTIFDGAALASETLTLGTSGVNTTKLMKMEHFIRYFQANAGQYSIAHFNKKLDDIDHQQGNYKIWGTSMAAACACAAFTLLLGGGAPEMTCAFLGAFSGQFLRKKMIERKMTTLLTIVPCSVLSLLVYIGVMKIGESLLGIDAGHATGFFCAMLFVIPGFPLITGEMDIIKLDLRSGIERIMYAVYMILLATLAGWAVSAAIGLKPEELMSPSLSSATLWALRILMSFIAVFGFSILFNSTPRMALAASLVGMVANTLRLALLDFSPLPFNIAAFLGALTAGLLSYHVKQKSGFPRISIAILCNCFRVKGPSRVSRASFLFLAQLNIFNAASCVNACYMVDFFFLLLLRGLPNFLYHHGTATAYNLY